MVEPGAAADGRPELAGVPYLNGDYRNGYAEK
jgi:hypothetical protein